MTADAASGTLAELILTHDRERRARTVRAVVASRHCVFAQHLDCDIQDETPMAVGRRDTQLSENAPVLAASEEPSDAASGVLVEWVSDRLVAKSKLVVSQMKLQSKSSCSMLVPADQLVATPRAHDWRTIGSC